MSIRTEGAWRCCREAPFWHGPLSAKGFFTLYFVLPADIFPTKVA
jgi:hypothetical protein